MAVTNRTLSLLRSLRADVGTQADSVVRELTAAWIQAWDVLSGQWDDAIADAVAAYVSAGVWPAPWQLARIERLVAAQQSTAQALTALAASTNTTVGLGAAEVVAATAVAEPAVMASQLPAGLAAAALETYAARVAPSALEAVVLRARQQIHAGTWPLSGDAVDALRRALITGVATGEHPRRAAAHMIRQVEGVFNGGLGRATNLARTEMLDAYRQASAAVHEANADVLDGWTWIATLDRRTCFPAGTWIKTRAGQVPIEAVRVGDEVLTHTGAWCRVYETLDQVYDGPMVTVEAGPLRVTATADHPFLIERQGELHWIEAQHIRRGDNVLSDRESSPDGASHLRGERPVERRSDQPHNGPAEALHVESLTGITGGDLGVPVRLVNLKGDPAADEKVDRALPARDDGFLLVGDTERVKGTADVTFGHRLAGVPPVAAHRAEPSRAVLLGAYAEGDAAGEAVDHDGRSAARLGTVGMPGAGDAEDGATAGAGPVLRVGAGAFGRAIGVSDGCAVGKGEGLAASGADLFGPAGGDAGATGTRTELAGPRGACPERLAAGADAIGPGSSLVPLAAVGMFSLVGGVAGPAAEFPGAFPDPRGVDLVSGPASGTHPVQSGVVLELEAVSVGAGQGTVLQPSVSTIESGLAATTGEFHRHIVSSVATQIQATRVYNVEVESDHSYIAAGFVVHNCPSCWGMHGTHHPLDQAGPLDHQQGRCARMPKVKSWAELGIPGVESEDLTPNAERVFAALPAGEQLAIMGPGRLALLNAGRIQWADLATLRDSQAWRPSYAPRPVRELQALAARRAVA